MKLLVGKFSTERNMQSVSRLPVGEAVGCRCEDMKALPVALITVASIGIVSLIGIGLFFALLPTKTKISPQAATFETTIMPITSTRKMGSKLIRYLTMEMGNQSLERIKENER
ncbi:hypothetical protein T10_11704 [Trichinella papuae]|uniref:Uncharacterized protein n=1 Tax=Trichinella papuae TaxID=268474 RepID=A0A0V1N6Q6_9BILA|nr:hypothetical protein T10_11704 [Trichinella papuae]